MPDNRRRAAASTTSRCPATRASAAASGSAGRRARRAPGIGVFVLIGLLGLGVVAGLAATAAFIDNLPKLSRLGPVELGENSSVYARDCTRKPCQDEALGVIARTENRISVRWKDIAPTMRSATVAVEDRRYWEHGALDWHGIARAAGNNLQAGGIRQGGSTISQQLAKNLYLLREASSRSLSRKIDEAWIAVQLEDKYTKAEILTAYLNTVFYGESAYGVEAAAHTFFDKTAKQLTLAQSALLAGLPQAPSAYNPFVHPAAATKRRAEVLGAMRELRWISAGRLREGDQRAARASSAGATARRRPRPSCSTRCGRSSTRGCRPSSPPAAVCASTRRSTSACSSRRGGRSRTCSRRRAIPRRRSSRSTCTTATCSRSAPRTTARPRTSSTSRPPGTARRARRSSSSRSSSALRRGADPSRVYYPSGYVSFPENDPVCPQPGGWSPHNAEAAAADIRAS